MRGHIVKRGKDSYSIKVGLGRDAGGKYRYQWVTVKGTKKDAERRLSEILHQLDNGVFTKPGKTTLAEFLERWLADYVRPNLAPRTAEGYEHIIRHHLIPALGSRPLTQLKPEHLQALYAVKLQDGLSPRTVRHHHVTLHTALGHAVRMGLLSHNVADAVSPPRYQRRELQTLSESDLHRFLEAARATPYYVLFYLALFTGMRRSELLALRWCDLDLPLGRAHVTRALHHLQTGETVFRAPKSARSRRMVALSPSVALLLQEHRDEQAAQSAMLGVQLKEDDLVFSDPEGRPLRPDTVTHAWVKLARRTGLHGIRLHDARHTHATLMLKQGVHPKIVQERLGHASIQLTLDTYSHVVPGLQQAAAARFDEMVLAPPGSRAVENT